MLVLGLETSCDETAAAVVEDGRRVLGDAIYSQVALHATWGGIVPEIASRAHVEKVLPVIDEALARAHVSIEQIDAVAVTRGPGLVGALLVGVQVGKALAWSRGLPLVGVNHLEGHLAAVFLDEAGDVPRFPHLGLLVSGGHSELLVVEGHGTYRQLGATRDDAAGEAFDKVGKLLGLGYPAGATIDRLALTGNPKAVALPRAMRGKGYDMSFSGLKTAVAHELHECVVVGRDSTHVDSSQGSAATVSGEAALLPRSGSPRREVDIKDLCASFQAALVEQIAEKVALALRNEGLTELVVSGGVAANRGLRAALEVTCRRGGGRLFAPPLERCTDNAAMIACAGFHRLQRGERADLALNAVASLPLDINKPKRKGAGLGKTTP